MLNVPVYPSSAKLHVIVFPLMVEIDVPQLEIMRALFPSLTGDRNVCSAAWGSIEGCVDAWQAAKTADAPKSAMTDLVAILEARRADYAHAEAEVDTSGDAVEQSFAKLLRIVTLLLQPTVALQAE